jgi:hypothetical protein
MSARCRCGEDIDWRFQNGRRTAFEADGLTHACPLTRRRKPVKRTPVHVVAELETIYDDLTAHWNTGPVRCAEPAVIRSIAYERDITRAARELGVRERDLAYTVAYRAACDSSTSKHTAA